MGRWNQRTLSSSLWNVRIHTVLFLIKCKAKQNVLIFRIKVCTGRTGGVNCAGGGCHDYKLALFGGNGRGATRKGQKNRGERKIITWIPWQMGHEAVEAQQSDWMGRNNPSVFNNDREQNVDLALRSAKCVQTLDGLFISLALDHCLRDPANTHTASCLYRVE